MVTMLPSVWQSVTVLALVVIVSTNVSQVSSYCSDRSGVCIADNHLDRKEREAVLAGRLQRGNELDRTVRDSLRRDVNARDHIRETEINRFDRLESQSRLKRNIRLSRQDQRRIESDEQNNRFDKRQLKPRNHRYQQIETLSRRLEHNQNRNNLRSIEIRNDVERKSSNDLKEEFTRLDRIREDRVRYVDDREQRLYRRVNNQQALGNQVYELRMRENRVHEERVREERVQEARVIQERVRQERVRKESVRVERVREERTREIQKRVRKEPVRVERVREERTRKIRFLDEIKKAAPEARNEHFGEERSRSNVRNELIRSERIVDNILNREEITRRQLPDRSYNTREVMEILNVNTRSEIVSDRKDNRQIRVEDSHRSLNDRRENRRVEMESESRNERRHEGRLEDIAERQIRSVEDRRQLENRLSINKNIENRDGFRRIDSIRDISSRRDIVNDSEEKGNRYSDRLSAFHNDDRRDTSLKEFTQLNSPQLSWNFYQAVLIGAIVLQIIKYKDGISKSKSLNAFMNYLPLMSHNHIKAL